MEGLTMVHDMLVQWLAEGLLQATWWQIVLFTLCLLYTSPSPRD